MQLEKWFEERLRSGVLIIRAHQQRQSLGSSPYVGLDVRVYSRCVIDGEFVILLAEISEEVGEDGVRQRGRTVVHTHGASDQQIQSKARQLTGDWIPQWKVQTDHLYVVNRTGYPVSNPSMTRYLSRIQGGLEILAVQHLVDATAGLKLVKALERVVTDAQQELGRHVAFPHS